MFLTSYENLNSCENLPKASISTKLKPVTCDISPLHSKIANFRDFAKVPPVPDIKHDKQHHPPCETTIESDQVQPCVQLLHSFVVNGDQFQCLARKLDFQCCGESISFKSIGKSCLGICLKCS